MEMPAIETLYELNRQYQAQKEIVEKECNSLGAATALMKKWDESRLIDAIYREAKHRAFGSPAPGASQ